MPCQVVVKTRFFHTLCNSDVQWCCDTKLHPAAQGVVTCSRDVLTSVDFLFKCSIVIGKAASPLDDSSVCWTEIQIMSELECPNVQTHIKPSLEAPFSHDLGLLVAPCWCAWASEPPRYSCVHALLFIDVEMLYTVCSVLIPVMNEVLR